MKKSISMIFSIITILISLGLFPSCSRTDPINVSNKTSNNISSTTSQNEMKKSETKMTNQPSSISNNSTSEGVGGGVMKVHKYRAMFYSVPAPFVNLVGRETFFNWRETIDATSTAETMVMSQFIQHFGITREQFDKANLEWAKGIRDNLDGVPCINPKDYANQITDEIFNGDIIFTFDDDLIREYYLSPDYPYLYDIEFEEAVAKGEYTSQTEEWVDVEAMEAEIIAKYGEAEIVTDTAVQTSIETTAEVTTAVETTIPETEAQITE